VHVRAWLGLVNLPLHLMHGSKSRMTYHKRAFVIFIVAVVLRPRAGEVWLTILDWFKGSKLCRLILWDE
jgi:ABC-type cobalamin transport system permease subunit